MPILKKLRNRANEIESENSLSLPRGPIGAIFPDAAGGSGSSSSSCDSCSERSAHAPKHDRGMSAGGAREGGTRCSSSSSLDSPTLSIRSLSPSCIALPPSPPESVSMPARSSPELAGATDFDDFLAGTTKFVPAKTAPRRIERPDGMVRVHTGLMRLPQAYTLCPRGSFCQIQDECAFSHHDRSFLYPVSASENPICKYFLVRGFCPSNGASCRIGAHPCMVLSRRNQCNDSNCKYAHNLRITPSGELINAPRYGEVAGSLLPVNSISSFFGGTYRPRVYDSRIPDPDSAHGPRSDNDYTVFRYISAMPTIDETLGRPDVYLPLKGTPKGHEQVLDIGFRHLRESAIGAARETVTRALFALVSGGANGSGGLDNSVDQWIYPEAKVSGISHSEWIRQLVSVNLSFQCLSQRKMGGETRFESGGLIALVSLDKPAGAAEAVPRVVFLRTIGDWSDRDGKGRRSQTGRVSGELFATETIDDDLEFIVNQTQGIRPTVQVLVDIPGILVNPTYVCLNVLRQMATASLPFARSAFAAKGMVYEIPKYLQGTKFDLTSLGLKGESVDIPTGNASSSFVAELKGILESQGKFYPGQQDAIVQSLTKGLSLIQGPPGTGKSFTSRTLVKALAANRRSISDDPPPILVTAQTNHALDQFLTALGKEGLKVARLGRPYGEDEELNLDPNHYVWNREYLSNSTPKRRTVTKNFIKAADYLDEVLGLLETGELRYGTLTAFLAGTAPEFLSVFTSKDIFARWSRMDDLMEEAELAKKLQAIIPRGFGREGFVPPDLECPVKGPDRPLSVLQKDLDIWEMTSSERTELLGYWKAQMALSVVSQTVSAIKNLEVASAEKRKDDLEVIAKKIRQYKADVVGCTMAGASTMYDVLRLLGVEVVVIEEAGEIMESRTLPAFLPTVQHMIMIGDHMQLKPFCENPKMAGKPYDLDVSLFERLASKGNDGSPANFSMAQLDVQRRMRPQIADFIRALGIYPALHDGPNVMRYPDAPAMNGKNILWINHSEPETFGSRGDSYCNVFEARMIAEHCALLMGTGEYRVGDIVVIVPYRAQVKEIKAAFQKVGPIHVSPRPADQELAGSDRPKTPNKRQSLTISEGAASTGPWEKGVGVGELAPLDLRELVRIVTVDGYQGEEADVVIVSCVRSNDQGRIGFTDVLNRVCVLLSRARKGLYFYGNAGNMSHSSRMWNTIVTLCSARGYITEGIEIGSCSRHPTDPILAKKPEDFKKQGVNCVFSCGIELPCGHTCDRICHRPTLHGLPGYTCREPCKRDAGCGHKCAMLCGRLCKCSQSEAVLLKCGHTIQQPCGTKASEFCGQPCGVLLVCGHMCSKVCDYWACKEQFHECGESCGKEIGCGHRCERACHRDTCPSLCMGCEEKASLTDNVIKHYDSRLAHLERYYNMVTERHEASEERERAAQGLNFTGHEAFEKNLDVLRGRVTEFENFQDKIDELGEILASVRLPQTYNHHGNLGKLAKIKEKLLRMLVADWEFLAGAIDAGGTDNARMKNFATIVHSIIDHIRPSQEEKEAEGQ